MTYHHAGIDMGRTGKDSETRGSHAWAQGLGHDLKRALRMVSRSRGFSAIVILTMALGIGATTAVFSVVNAVLLRPLPFKQADRLTMVWENWTRQHRDQVVVSPGNFTDWKRLSRSFESMAAVKGSSTTAVFDGEPTTIVGVSVSSEFFSTLGIQPAVGRPFAPEEQQKGGPRAVIVGRRLWRRLGSDPNLVGKTVRFMNQLYAVVGIMPQGFDFPNRAEVWFPLFLNPDERGSHDLRVIARLRPGAKVTQAEAEMKSIAAGLATAYPAQNGGISASVVALQDQIVGDVRRSLVVLFATVICVLLIACANTANLLLVRGLSRTRDVAIRIAIGASRWQVIRSLLLEGVLLSLLGGAGGALWASWLVRLFVDLDPIRLPRVQEIGVDATVLLFALVTSVVTGIVFGLAPALRISRPDLASSIKEGALNQAGCHSRSSWGRFALTAAQIAISIVLLVGTGLLVRSFVLRVTVPIGFQPQRLLGADISYRAHRRIDQLLEQLRAVPGVEAAGAGTAFPQDGPGSTCDTCVQLEGQLLTDKRSRTTGLYTVTTDYFRAAGIPLQRGRFIGREDGAATLKAAVVNEAFAHEFMPGEDPIGRRFRWGNDPWLTIVGIAGNVSGFGMAGDPKPAVYLSNQQSDWGNGVYVLVRTAIPPANMAANVRTVIRSWDPRLLIDQFGPVETMLSASVTVPRFYMLFMAAFTALALAISALGLYATISQSVAQRTREIGIRMALGARPRDIQWKIIIEGCRTTAAGVAIGLACAWNSTRVVESLLFGVSCHDAQTFFIAAALFATVALLACYFPARRATGVDPVKALSAE
jgi:putative ABC transport system permease protein